MYQVGDKITIEIYPEYYMDTDEKVHNHFDCPVCHKKYADTDQPCDMDLFLVKSIKCEVCSSVFELVSESWYFECKVEVMKVP